MSLQGQYPEFTKWSLVLLSHWPDLGPRVVREVGKLVFILGGHVLARKGGGVLITNYKVKEKEVKDTRRP